jgi:pilus assembly protein CpaB
VLAAVLALVLALVGILLVINYANRADERALQGMETDNVYVAIQAIEEGTPSVGLAELVETRAVPVQFQEPGAVTDLADVAGQVLVSDLLAGEQLQTAHFATAEELRGQGEFDLPEEAQDLHQVTIPLDNPRALGGAIAAGDTVGVFGSFQVQSEDEYVLDAEGNVERVPEGQSEDNTGEGVGDFSLTDLLIHKALVVRVEGGYVAPPPGLGAEDDEGDAEGGPADTIHVTLALGADDAGGVIYAMEFGSLWLTLEPETASDEETRTVVITVPERARNVVE